MKYKLLRGLVVGKEYKQPGAIISADGRYADMLVRAGAAQPATEAELQAQAQAQARPQAQPEPEPFDKATARAPEAAERAVGRRQQDKR